LLDKLGCLEDARAPFEAAAVRAGNGREHGLLRRRAMDAADAAMPSSQISHTKMLRVGARHAGPAVIDHVIP
jgi:hypothetical protein